MVVGAVLPCRIRTGRQAPSHHFPAPPSSCNPLVRLGLGLGQLQPSCSHAALRCRESCWTTCKRWSISTKQQWTPTDSGRCTFDFCLKKTCATDVNCCPVLACSTYLNARKFEEKGWGPWFHRDYRVSWSGSCNRRMKGFFAAFPLLSLLWSSGLLVTMLLRHRLVHPTKPFF